MAVVVVVVVFTPDHDSKQNYLHRSVIEKGSIDSQSND
jgi:hypothetical protein